MKLKDLTHISQETRDRVYERDSYDGWPCCVYCGSPRNIEVHHYIERSRGGKGIEQNLICLCTRCHTKVHNGDDTIKHYIESYLHDHYEGWDEETLIARKELKWETH